MKCFSPIESLFEKYTNVDIVCFMHVGLMHPCIVFARNLNITLKKSAL